MGGDGGVEPLQMCMLLVLSTCSCLAAMHRRLCCQSVWTVSDLGGVRQMANNARHITAAKRRLRPVSGRAASLTAWLGLPGLRGIWRV